MTKPSMKEVRLALLQSDLARAARRRARATDGSRAAARLDASIAAIKANIEEEKTRED